MMALFLTFGFLHNANAANTVVYGPPMNSPQGTFSVPSSITVTMAPGTFPITPNVQNNSSQSLDIAWNPSIFTFSQVAPGGPGLITIRPGGSAWFSINLNFSSPGRYEGFIVFMDFSGSDGNVNVPLIVNVIASAAPHIAVSPSSLSFSAAAGSNPTSRTLTITNDGPSGSTLSWTATKVQNSGWLSFSPATGSLGSGASANLTVSINSSALTAGTYNDTLRISGSNATNNPQNVPVTLTVAPPAGVTVSCPNNCNIGALAGGRAVTSTITIRNSGSSPLNWTASPGQSWLNLSSLSGTTPANSSTTLILTVNPTGLTAGNYSSLVTVSGGGSPVSATVSAAVGTPIGITTSLWNIYRSSNLTTVLQTATYSGLLNYTAAGLSVDTYQARLTVTNSTGQTASVTQNFTVLPTVNNPPVCSFSATPPSIKPPQSSDLTWNCSDATSCSIDSGIGSVSPTTGTKSVAPTSTTTYGLSCTGPGGTANPAATVTVTISGGGVIEINPL